MKDTKLGQDSNCHKHHHKVKVEKKERTLLKAIGSVLFAFIASSHHWLHTLLIALGFTTLGSGLLLLSPSIKIIFLLVSLLVSGWFIIVAKRKWNHNRPSAWVYLISSIISIILVVSAIPQTINELNTEKTSPQQQEQQQTDNPEEHNLHH